MEVKCPVCGWRFNSGDLKNACARCPFGPGCKRICCPNCLYSWVESTSIVGRLVKLAGGPKLGKS